MVIIGMREGKRKTLTPEWMEGRPPSMAHLFRFVFVSLYLSAMNRVRHVYRWGEIPIKNTPMMPTPFDGCRHLTPLSKRPLRTMMPQGW